MGQLALGWTVVLILATFPFAAGYFLGIVPLAVISFAMLVGLVALLRSDCVADGKIANGFMTLVLIVEAVLMWGTAIAVRTVGALPSVDWTQWLFR